jgi:GAF domain-containing protein
VVSVFDNVTERRQAEDRIARQTRLLTAINRLFAETLKSDSSETVARTCLAVAQEITSSDFGFIGEVNSAGLFNTTSISNPGWEACALKKSEAAVALNNMTVRGIWGQVILREQAFIVNHPDSFPQRVGLPEGHPPITSFLGVPLRDQGKTIGMMALANRAGGYTDEQREDLEALAVSFVEAMRRNRAEEKVKNMYQELEKRVVERTEALVAKTSELERINRVFVDRELKMRELKARIAEMEKRSS